MKNPDQVSQHHADTQKQFAVDQIIRRVEQALDDPAQFRPGNMPVLIPITLVARLTRWLVLIAIRKMT
ncbi:MAG: hypothetical protein IPJ49_20190 [Candidatus Obscuribacter sp.]|nr:hypothetical protein [Candidatus Obscuribacter sp.]